MNEQWRTPEARANARWQHTPIMSAENMPMTAGGVNIHVSFSANTKGGMTPSEFIKWIEEDILPHCPHIGPDYWYFLLIDGDDSHALDADNMAWCAEHFIHVMFSPPNTTGDVQAHDDKKGSFRNFKGWSWKSAKLTRKRQLARGGSSNSNQQLSRCPTSTRGIGIT